MRATDPGGKTLSRDICVVPAGEKDCLCEGFFFYLEIFERAAVVEGLINFVGFFGRELNYWSGERFRLFFGFFKRAVG